jgi:hypothetical protein
MPTIDITKELLESVTGGDHAMVIFSSNHHPLELFTDSLHCQIPLKTLLGSWEGVLEMSYSVPAQFFLEFVEYVHDQHCVMIVKSNLDTVLLYIQEDFEGERIVPIGKWNLSSLETVVENDLPGFTFDPETLDVFVVH